MGQEGNRRAVVSTSPMKSSEDPQNRPPSKWLHVYSRKTIDSLGLKQRVTVQEKGYRYCEIAPK